MANTEASEETVAMAGHRSLCSSRPSPLREAASAATVEHAVAGCNPRATVCRNGTYRTGLAVSAYNN